MTLAEGSRLGPYEILSPLGAGGMGEVYRARDSRLGRDVAIKVLTERLAGDREYGARFEREARAVAAVSHPNILAIFDFGEQDRLFYSVTELLEGETLRHKIMRERLSWRRSVEIATAVSEGLAAAHSRGIVHRDIKPENIFLTSGGLVKILDFGLARPPTVSPEDQTSTPTESVRTEAGTVLGTVGYMSPEQVSGEPAEAQGDIFSLGCILYEMLTGRRAFSGASPGQTMAAILRDQPPEIAGSGVLVPEGLDRIVTRCLEKSPSERFQSAHDLAFALRSLDQAGRHSGSEVGVASAAALEQANSNEASVAVLPFRNMSADPETDYFSDGVTEEIIGVLSQIPGLRVAARTSCFAFKGKDTDVRRIGRELGVRTILEGSVRRAGRRLRIAAQLIDVATGYHLWSQRYDREMEDVFAVQDEIASSIAGTFQPVVLGATAAASRERPTQNVEAYDLYLQGRHFWKLRRLRLAIEQFEAAVAKDPGYVAAWTAIADSYSVWGYYGGISTWEAYARARAAAERAQELAPDSADIHLSLGVIEYYYGWDIARAERELRLSIERNPKLMDAYFWLTLLLGLSGRFEEALEAGRTAVALEPHSANAQAGLAWVYTWAGRYVEGLREHKKAVALDPSAAYPLWSLGYAQYLSGSPGEAIDTLEHAVAATQREHSLEIALLGCALGEAGREQEARTLLAELKERASREYLPRLDLALLHASLGENAQALTELEKAYEDRNGGLWYNVHVPIFNSLRSEPRWRALADKLARTAPILGMRENGDRGPLVT